MPSEREYDYEKIVRSFMKQNVSANHLSDVKNLKKSYYLENLDKFVGLQSELLQEKEKHNLLTKQVEELMRAKENVTEDINMYTEKCKEVDEKIKEEEREKGKHVIEFGHQMQEFTETLQNIESKYDVDRIKREALDAVEKNATLIQISKVKHYKYEELQKTYEEFYVEMPNLKTIFDDSFEERMRTYENFGDLNASKKKLSDITNKYNELKNKVDGLLQDNK